MSAAPDARPPPAPSPGAAPAEPAARGEATMRRELSAWLAAFVVVNTMIGTGIFKTPAKVARLTGAMPAALATWVAGGALALCGALSLAELAAAMPRTGGLYEYLRRSYGSTTGFVFGWTRLVLLTPSAVGSFAKLGAEALASLLGLRPDARRDTRTAIVFVVACTAMNLAGVRNSARQQGAVTALKYLGVLALAVVGLTASTVLPAAATTGSAAATALPHAAGATFLGFFAALVSVMWAYDGWADVAMLSGEVRDPGRALPRALVAGTVAVAAVYLAVNLGYARVLGIAGLRAATETEIAGLLLAVRTMGPAGHRVLSGLIFVSCLGGCLSTLLTSSRVIVPMATDGLLPRWLGEVSPRTGAPTRAVLVGGALGVAFVSFRSFEQLTEGFVVGLFPFYILAVVAVFVLRRRAPELPRPFRVPGYPLVPGAFVLGATLLLIGAASDANHTALFPLAVVAAGVPLRYLLERRAATASSPPQSRG